MSSELIVISQTQLELIELATQGPVGTQGDVGLGVPSGGALGQILTKIDETDYNTEWADPATPSVGWGSIDGTLAAITTGSSSRSAPERPTSSRTDIATWISC